MMFRRWRLSRSLALLPQKIRALVIAPSPLAGPLRQRATGRFSITNWVRGKSATPHPTEFADRQALPSLAREKGTATDAIPASVGWMRRQRRQGASFSALPGALFTTLARA